MRSGTRAASCLVASHAHRIALILTLALAACSTKTDTGLPATATESPVAEARAAAAGKEPEAEPPRESQARSVDGYKRDAARRIYFRNAKLLFDGAPPPVLKSIVVLTIRADAKGTPTSVKVMRSNGYHDLEQVAMKSVRDASPLPVPHPAVLKNGGIEYVETWLFRDDGRYQIRSLADAQQSIGD